MQQGQNDMVGVWRDRPVHGTLDSPSNIENWKSSVTPAVIAPRRMTNWATFGSLSLFRSVWCAEQSAEGGIVVHIFSGYGGVAFRLGSREPGPQNPAGIWVGTRFVPVLSGTGKRCRGLGTKTDAAQPYCCCCREGFE